MDISISYYGQSSFVYSWNSLICTVAYICNMVLVVPLISTFYNQLILLLLLLLLLLMSSVPYNAWKCLPFNTGSSR